MKKNFLFAVVAVATIGTAFSAVTIRYTNKDSKSHQMRVAIDGSQKAVTFDASRTSSVTIQGTATKAIIETSCGRIEVKDGSSVEISNGCLKITNAR